MWICGEGELNKKSESNQEVEQQYEKMEAKTKLR
jgi:hypothetical protein